MDLLLAQSESSGWSRLIILAGIVGAAGPFLDVLLHAKDKGSFREWLLEFWDSFGQRRVPDLPKLMAETPLAGDSDFGHRASVADGSRVSPPVPSSSGVAVVVEPER